jgi:hypothetical protein
MDPDPYYLRTRGLMASHLGQDARAGMSWGQLPPTLDTDP